MNQYSIQSYTIAAEDQQNAFRPDLCVDLIGHC